MKRILVACVGNIFHGDDAFGVEVARELSKRPLPEQVAVEDFGIRAYDLAYALTDNYDAVILADVMSRGKAPGTVCLVEPDQSTPIVPEPTMVDPHSMHTVAVLRMAQSLGGVNGKLFLVGCEPAGQLECEGGEMGLSAPVRAAVPTAVAMIESLANNLINETQRNTAG